MFGNECYMCIDPAIYLIGIQNIKIKYTLNFCALTTRLAPSLSLTADEVRSPIMHTAPQIMYPSVQPVGPSVECSSMYSLFVGEYEQTRI